MLGQGFFRDTLINISLIIHFFGAGCRLHMMLKWNEREQRCWEQVREESFIWSGAGPSSVVFAISLLIEKNTYSYPKVGMGDNCAILDFSQRHLTGHSWTYLRNFWFCRIFFRAKLPPRTAKTVFANPKGPPFGCWKKNSLNQIFIKAMWWHLLSWLQNGITLGYCK